MILHRHETIAYALPCPFEMEVRLLVRVYDLLVYLDILEIVTRPDASTQVQSMAQSNLEL